MTSLSDNFLFLDSETYSSEDITSSGLYKYAESKDFEVLLIQYAFGEDPIEVIDLASNEDLCKAEQARAKIWKALLDPDVIKVAHNAAFERTCLGRHFGVYLDSRQWMDTMILCSMNGLPASLDAAGAALKLKDQKIKEGVSLISYFCKPCKPTKSNGGRLRNLPEHNPEKWTRFKEYGKRDVEVEREILRRLIGFEIPFWERCVCSLDARINERGVMLDRDLIAAAIEVDGAIREEHLGELQKLTGFENPNSVQQLRSWLESVGVHCENLDKETVKGLREKLSDKTTDRVLELRQLLGKTSTKKYQAMESAVCSDDRVRGLLQYYGAGRTGRWAGRLVQVQNLPQNHLDAIANVRELVRLRDLDLLKFVFDNVPDVLSQLIRTAFIAKPHHTFLVADYSAIEARVIAYLAGEQWRMDTFANGGDIYCQSASQMFGVPVVKHGTNGELRQKGKIAELACGYGGGVGALKAFGADKMGLTESEMQAIVEQWRAASPTIPRFWRDAEGAAKRALSSAGRTISLPCGVEYRRDADALRCRLPSGRTLSYWGARIDDSGAIVFMAQDQTSRRWGKTDTWGGKLVENIVQAYARDCLATAMLRLDKAGYDICFHVHDEIIAEAPEGSRWEDMAEIMGQPIKWAPGLLLKAEGYSTKFYMKD